MCEKISRTNKGTLIKLKPMPDIKAIPIHQKLVNIGAEYGATTQTYLIPAELLVLREDEKLANIPLTDLVPGPNPRLKQPTVTLTELTQDIEKNGLKERIKVRPSPTMQGKFEIIDGNRRTRVAQLLKWTVIPAIITTMSDADAFLTCFVINHHREPFSQFERGRWFKLLMEKFPDKFPTQRALAEHVSVDHSTISRDIIYFEANSKPAPVPAPAATPTEKPSHEEPKNGEKDHGADGTKEAREPEPASRLAEFVDRQIRAAPVEVREELREQALREGLTAEQTKTRGEILVLIHKAPEKYQAMMLEGVQKHDWSKERVKRLVDQVTVQLPSLDEAAKNFLADGKREVKKEASKRRALVKKAEIKYEKGRLTDFISEETLLIVTERFGRQPPEVLARLARDFSHLAVQMLTPQQRKQILDSISKKGFTVHHNV